MTDWSEGYIADINYTYGHYEEVNPERVDLALLRSALIAPDIENACELGFGQGSGINLLSAASNVRWYGTDFNPGQVAHARELARKSGAAVELAEQAFEDFCARDDLPDFDYVAMHGIWTWISDRNRAVIVDFLERKLKPGGVLYISYNALPAWSEFLTLRNIMLDHVRDLGEDKPLAERIKSSLELGKELLDKSVLHGRAYPGLKQRLEKMAKQSPEYIAHEFFNDNWDPMDFRAMDSWLSDAKLTFACSANMFDHIDALNLSEEQRKLVSASGNVRARESLRDLILNQQFRRDYWVKGPRRIPPAAHESAFRKQQVVLLKPAADIQLTVKTGGGEANLNEKIYQPVIQALNGSTATTVAELEKLVAAHKITPAQLLEAIIVLCGAGHLAPARKIDSDTSARCAALNQWLVEQARHNDNQRYLASPVTGGGVATDRFERLFLCAQAEGHTVPDDWARFAVDVLIGQGQFMLQDGKTLRTKKANLELMQPLARQFADKRMPILKQLGVVQ